MTMDLAGRLAQLTPEQREMLRRELARREAPAEKVYPLSLMQERLWFLCNFMPESNDAYSMPAALCFRGPLNVDALQGAMEDLVARHEALRTTFAERDGEPVQIVAPTQEVTIARTDSQACPRKRPRLPFTGGSRRKR